MTAQPITAMTQAEFLAWELGQAERYELVDGYVQPLLGDRSLGLAGGTKAHGQLATELISVILPAARPCRTYGSDVKIETYRSTRYADVCVTCDDRDRDDRYVVRHPKLIVEILSESTAREDLGPKLREYQTIDALEEYAMIDSRKRWLQVLRRTGGRWELSAPVDGGTLEFVSLGTTTDLDALYDVVGVARAD